MLTDDELNALEAMEQEATPGPWKDWEPPPQEVEFFDGMRFYASFTAEDARLLIALRNNAPALIASARALAESRAECERLRDAIRWDALCDHIKCISGPEAEADVREVEEIERRFGGPHAVIRFLAAVRGRVGK